MIALTYLYLILCEVPETEDGFIFDLLLEDATHSFHILAKLDAILRHYGRDVIPITTLMSYVSPYEDVINFFCTEVPNEVILGLPLLSISLQQASH